MAAFTLVEMLVAVGLVILMMTLFATIFQMATGAMSTQKGLAENDQRVRLVLTRLRNDLNGNIKNQNDPNRPYRTFRNLIPFGPDEQAGAPTSFQDRNGYFYISENDPNDDTDDVLALTVQFPSASSDQFFGRAAIVFPDTTGAASYGLGNPNPGAGYPAGGSSSLLPAPPPGNGQQYWPNQPEFDDIQGTPNGVADSQYAEVSYFLRRGTLYRRVMLIRQPNVSFAPNGDGTPTDNSGGSLNLGTYTNGIRNLWMDFDFASYFDGRSLGFRFHGTGPTTGSGDCLAPAVSPQNPFVVGNPAYRFGFDCSVTPAQNPTATYGQPREFITTPAGAVPPNTTFFIGHFTHGETSDPTFQYPGNLNGASGNPMNLTTTLNFNTTTGAVSNFAGPRAGEDVLMTNVLKFDIKIFDPAASVGPDGAAGVAGVDDDGDGNIDVLANGNIDFKELGWPKSDDGDFRDIGHLGSTGFYNFNPQNVPITMFYKLPTGALPADLVTAKATPALRYIYPNTNYNYGNVPANSPPFAVNANRFDTWNPSLDLDNNGKSDSPPFRPFSYGADGKPGVPFFDDDGINGIDDPGELGWPAGGTASDDYPIPLRAIQIKITFYDRTAKQVRETTLVQSLAYTP